MLVISALIILTMSKVSCGLFPKVCDSLMTGVEECEKGCNDDYEIADIYFTTNWTGTAFRNFSKCIKTRMTIEEIADLCTDWKSMRAFFGCYKSNAVFGNGFKPSMGIDKIFRPMETCIRKLYL
ncbi:uncharacterized protein LOC144160889 isoform X2 [Haemaphysalis longicornis]